MLDTAGLFGGFYLGLVYLFMVVVGARCVGLGICLF